MGEPRRVVVRAPVGYLLEKLLLPPDVKVTGIEYTGGNDFRVVVEGDGLSDYLMQSDEWDFHPNIWNDPFLSERRERQEEIDEKKE